MVLAGERQRVLEGGLGEAGRRACERRVLREHLHVTGGWLAH